MNDATASLLLQNLFIGVILTATSVSITVETLKEMGNISTKSGNAILGAAVIDDILGIIALTVITGFADETVNIVWTIGKLFLFLILSLVVGLIFHKFYCHWSESTPMNKQRYIIAAFVFCLLLSFSAEYFFGVADITGAYIAGLILSNTSKRKYINNRCNYNEDFRLWVRRKNI